MQYLDPAKDRSGSKAAVQGRSALLRHSPQHRGKQTIQGRTSLALEVESRMGVVAWAMRQRKAGELLPA
jgi:hypothetical protein